MMASLHLSFTLLLPSIHSSLPILLKRNVPISSKNSMPIWQEGRKNCLNLIYWKWIVDGSECQAGSSSAPAPCFSHGLPIAWHIDFTIYGFQSHLQPRSFLEFQFAYVSQEHTDIVPWQNVSFIALFFFNTSIHLEWDWKLTLIYLAFSKFSSHIFWPYWMCLKGQFGQSFHKFFLSQILYLTYEERQESQEGKKEGRAERKVKKEERKKEKS